MLYVLTNILKVACLGVGRHFWQTGDGHLVIGHNKHCCQPLDGVPPFAENDSQRPGLILSVPILDTKCYAIYNKIFDTIDKNFMLFV